jgi:hypothetical protein
MEIDKNTCDFPKNPDGSIEDCDMFISCQYGNKITTYGHMDDNKKTVWLTAYIPSVVRGRNIRKALDEKEIPYIRYHETDEEVEFLFKAKYIDEVATLLKAKVNGCDISPFSSKNLPKADVEIPTDEIEKYKVVIVDVQKGDLLLIHRLTEDFLVNILNKKLRKTDKSFDYSADMKKLMMTRMAKEYIFTKGFWNEYLTFLKKEINKFYKNKESR